MEWLIRFGGISVILIMFGIFFFIFREVVPLFRGAEVAYAGEVECGVRAKVLGVDEWGSMPFLYDGDCTVTFLDIESGRIQQQRVAGLEGLDVTCCSYDANHRRVAVGLADGRVGSFVVHYERAPDESGEGRMVPAIEQEPWFVLEHGAGPITEIAYGDSGTRRVLVAKRGEGSDASVIIVRLFRKRSLMGEGTIKKISETDVTEPEASNVRLLKASPAGDLVLVAMDDGRVSYYKADGAGVRLRQTFRPMGMSAPCQVDFLLGGMSLVLTGLDGSQEQWSLHRPSEDAERLFGRTQTLPHMEGGAVDFAASQRNRTFLVCASSIVSLRHSTSGSIRWEGDVGLLAHRATFDAKGEHFIVASADGRVRRFSVRDPHPEAGWKAFFGKVWYEGGAGPMHQWQSSGGSDDFEPKYSMVPLIFGSLKGTLYALLFSVPVALLAAIFSAAFLPANVRRLVKPVMELMASLPSVVIGFLAGLWLAPLLEDRVPSVLAALTLVPVSAIGLGALWCRMPIGFRKRFACGSEWWVVVPVILLAAHTGWLLGPLIESWWFVYQDPSTGREIADFRMWWPQATGLAFEQRNSLVLGFMMGFAVIPVIFTICEDALSNVPESLTIGAAALGANRWQVVWTILLPVGSSGIFSALMIGFGRAVGETMIMLMATGNTPVTEWNPFNGLRSLAANIAVERPEAPVGSTHYRVLFLSAILLFIMTFAMNTAADFLRQRLRDRNKLV